MYADITELVTPLRAKAARLAQEEAQLRKQYERVPAATAAPVIREEMRQRRARAHAEAEGLALQHVLAAEQALRHLGELLPQRPDEWKPMRDGRKAVDVLRARTKPAADAGRFARTPIDELLRLADVTDDVVALADMRGELEFRAEQGDERARSAANRIDVTGAVMRHSAAQEWRERYASRHVALSQVRATLAAIETGEADAGIEADKMRSIRQRLDAGTITTDQARAELQPKPTGTPGHGFVPATEQWRSTP